MSKSKEYVIGFILLIFGLAGMAEHITSERGSMLSCIIFFSVGLGLILDSYVRK